MTLGANTRLSKQLGVNVEGSAGNRGEAVQLGADYQVSASCSATSWSIAGTGQTRTRRNG